MNQDLAFVRFFSRWLLVILFTMAGYWKVFELTAANHANNFFVASYSDTWIPEWLLLALGYFIPYWELIAGLLLAVGLRCREVLISLGILLLITTYGHALKEPLFDIDGHTFTRIVLIFIVLAISAKKDFFTLDQYFDRRKEQ